MTTRTQGQYFSADAEKITAVQVILTTENSTADAADWMVNYDWPNAGDHQEWLDSAPASEIASWILTSDK